VEYTEDQKAAFRADYARRRRNQLMLSIPLALVVFAFASTDGRDAPFGLSGEASLTILFLVLAVGLVVSFRNWRCPACSRYLGRSFNPRHCPSCGVQLHD
jgi:hypothetical protein